MAKENFCRNIVEFAGHYVDGRFTHSEDPNGEFENICPADTEEDLGVIRYSYAEVDHAVEAARVAFKPWRRLKFEDRANFLKKYKESIKRKQDLLAETISIEMGKPLWESKTEVATMISKVDVTIDESMQYVEDFALLGIQDGVDGRCRFRPMGVMAVLGPFNFPGHLPNGHIVPALLTGNTVVFKPSEKTPLTGQLMADAFSEAGFPNGVFNMIQGEREVGRRLVTHPDVTGILFTGSYEVGTRIKQDTLQQHWKKLVLEMGGKNASVVWEDANLDGALRETFLGTFLTGGQRCTSTSRILVHEKLIDEFVTKFHQRAKAFKIGHPFEEPFIGPLIDKTTVDRYMKFTGIAEREGHEGIMRGKPLKLDYEGFYVAPSIYVMRKPSVEACTKSVFQQTEIFSPAVAIMPVRDLDEAIALTNATQYGLSASIFTQDPKNYEKFFDDCETGIVNWNKPTNGAHSRLPFGGIKKSGNHEPTALFSTKYCAYPVTSLESTKLTNEAPTQPGLNWE